MRLTRPGFRLDQSRTGTPLRASRPRRGSARGYTSLLLPPAPIELALPYWTQIDPLPSVIESGCVPPTGPPVAKTEELTTVGPDCA
jgi:hypothetical protein